MSFGFHGFDDDEEDYQSFQKLKKAPKTGKITNPRKGDSDIRAARKAKERAKQALLEEQDEQE